MSSELLEVVEKLRISSGDSAVDNNGSINDRLHEHRFRKRKRPTKAQLKQKLEEDFLSPPTAFGTDWLNRFQQ